MTEHKGPSIVTIVGTSRPNSFTAKALELVNDELVQQGVEVTCLRAEEMVLNFPGQPETDDAGALKEVVAGATALVLATPEYHGSFAGSLKLIIENLGFPSVMSGKPVGLLGVAAGRIGAIKSLEQLRSVCSHVGALPLPGPISLAGVRGLFDEDGRCTDPATEKAVRGVAISLMDYIHDKICPKHALEQLVRDGKGPN